MLLRGVPLLVRSPARSPFADVRAPQISVDPVDLARPDVGLPNIQRRLPAGQREHRAHSAAPDLRVDLLSR
jgi:hypothetical protein